MFGVYRVSESGRETYVSRTATENEKLAREIAADLSRGEIVRPDGSIARIPARPHIAKEIKS
jgi:hypothetical protein